MSLGWLTRWSRADEVEPGWQGDAGLVPQPGWCQDFGEALTPRRMRSCHAVMIRSGVGREMSDPTT